MKRHHQRLLAYAGAIALVVGGALLAKFVETTSGLGLAGAGLVLMGKLAQQTLPPLQNRRKDDPPAGEKVVD